MVRREQICHPISHCSSILFSSPFLCSPLSSSHFSSFSKASVSPSPLHSHPRPPCIFTSHILYCVDCRDAISHFHSLRFSLSFLFIFVSHSFLFCLPHFPSLSISLSLSLCLCKRGGCGLAVMERDEFLIAVRQHRALLLVRISQGGEAKAGGKKRKRTIFFIGCI